MKYLNLLATKNLSKNLSKEICLLRADFNIQNDFESQTRPNLRIISVLPTIKFLINRGAKVVILSHRGRPKINQKYKQFSLRPFIKILSSLLKKRVNFISLREFGLINETKKRIQNSVAGSIFLIENLRFLYGEEKNDRQFAKRLASLGTFYVNDAFSVSHRASASVVAITKFLPSYAGLALENELKNLNQGVKAPKKPLVVVLGGAKISDKIGVIKNFLKRADYFLIGGGMANTFIAARNLPIGDSLYEKKLIPIARQLLTHSTKIILPIDLIIKNKKILDIGPKTVKEYTRILKKAKTVIWNGPMGYIEEPQFSKGTKAIAKAILKSHAFSIVGGGETTSVFTLYPKPYTLNPNLFVSTGGGAMLKYLAGNKLPGIQALHQRQYGKKII